MTFAPAGGYGGPSDVAPVRATARVSLPREVVHVALVCHRGLTITGRVVDANGVHPAGMVSVRARSESFEASGYADPQEGGRFSLGPLIPGRYEVRVLGGGWSNSQYAEAGARDLEFELRSRR